MTHSSLRSSCARHSRDTGLRRCAPCPRAAPGPYHLTPSYQSLRSFCSPVRRPSGSCHHQIPSPHRHHSFLGCRWRLLEVSGDTPPSTPLLAHRSGWLLNTSTDGVTPIRFNHRPCPPKAVVPRLRAFRCFRRAGARLMVAPGAPLVRGRNESSLSLKKKRHLRLAAQDFSQGSDHAPPSPEPTSQHTLMRHRETSRKTRL